MYQGEEENLKGMSNNFLVPVTEIDVHQLSSVIRNRTENVLIIDSRSFTEHNACHITSAVNVSCSKVVKRRLQQDKLSIKELLIHTCNCDVDEKLDVIVYDQSTKDASTLSPDSFIVILLKKLQLTFRSVSLLSGGFDEFRKFYVDLCEDKPKKCPPLTSLSQPCLPITNQGPTRILPFLYLGSQLDAMNKELMKDCNITHALNVSTTCPQPEFLPESHFMRIPVNDSYSEKLLQYFPEAFNFLDKVREGNSCVLVHCLAGVSRSPTVAIAYVMRYLRLSSDDGYRYVKAKRPTISPNFNFLGQLLEYEKQLRNENILEAKSEARPSPPVCDKKRICRTDMRNLALSLDLDPKPTENSQSSLHAKKDQSPTTALAKLSFDVPKCEVNDLPLPDFKQFRSKSCYGDFLRSYEDSGSEKKTKDMGNISAKVLSPVKEIKCDGLISEISTGNSEISMKCKGVVRQRCSQYSREEKRSNISQKYCNKYDIHSNVNRENFSLLTLTHLSSSSSNKLHKKFENTTLNKRRTNLFLDSEKQRGNFHEKKETKYNSRFPEKLTCHNSLVRSNENLLRSEDLELKFVSQDHSQFSSNPPFVHSLSLNSDLHKLSDSFGTSRYCNKNSDYDQQKTQNFNLMVDNEDLRDIFSNKEAGSNSSSSDNVHFPLIVSKDKNWIQNSKSPSKNMEKQLMVESMKTSAEAFNNNAGSSTSFAAQDNL